MPGGTTILRWEAPLLVRGEDATGARKAPRRGTSTDAEIVLPGHGLRYTGQIAELSARGCRLRTSCRLEDGTSVEVWLRTEGMPLRVAARLVDKDAGSVRFEFQPMPGRKQDQIEGLRAELGLAG